MDQNEQKQGNQIKISEDVIAIIVGLAISDVENIYAAPQGKKNKGGVSIKVENGEAVVDLNMAVRYGTKIPAVAALVQEKVSTAVENMTGLKVGAVNLNIVDIKLD